MEMRGKTREKQVRVEYSSRYYSEGGRWWCGVLEEGRQPLPPSLPCPGPAAPSSPFPSLPNKPITKKKKIGTSQFQALGEWYGGDIKKVEGGRRKMGKREGEVEGGWERGRGGKGGRGREGIQRKGKRQGIKTRRGRGGCTGGEREEEEEVGGL